MKRMKIIGTIIMVIMIVFMFTACDTKDPVLKGIGKKVEVQCGTEFNLDDYLDENLKITDETDEGTILYKLKDLEYSIDCDDAVYNSENGNVKTDDYGTYDVKLTVKDESGNKSTFEFKLFLNPVQIEKGFYMYPDESAVGRFNVQAFCEIKNTSSQFLKLSDVKLQIIDKDGVVAYETQDAEYAPEYLSAGDSCYVMDEMGGWSAEFNHEDDISDVVIEFNYDRDKTENDTTLEVDDMKVKHGAYSFDASTVVTNPYSRTVDYYEILAGMYDKDGKLIGVMTSYGDTTTLNPNGKGKALLYSITESNAIADKTVKVVGKARAIEFEGE